MSKNKSTLFYCFSPPIMIATFGIEIALALYTILTRKMNTVTWLGVILLVCLATFQLAEFNICENASLFDISWAKIGFASITLLPPLGIHMVYAISGKKIRYFAPIMYALAAVWIGLFAFGNVIQDSVCHGNYIIFSIPNPYEGFYYIFYDTLLMAAIWLGISFASKTKNKHTASALYSLVAGYLAFLIPSIIFTMVDQYKGADSPLPSVMCGFAVILALMLSFRVMPEAEKKN